MIARGVSFMQRVQKHPFVRQISGMMMLTAAGQGLYMLAGPFIGRLYSPEQVGYFGLFVTIWTVLALFACGVYDLAIPSARNDEEAWRLSGVSAALGVCIGVLSGFGLSVAASLHWFGIGIFPVWAGAVMAAAMLAQTAVMIGQAWAVRRDVVMTIGHANVLMNGLRSVLQVVGGLLSPVWAMMVAGEIAARLAQAKLLLKSTPSANRKPVRLVDLRTAIVEYRRFPLVFGPAFGLDAIATLLQTAMMGILFGPAEMGQFFLMRRTLDLPVAFAFRSLSDLFFARQLILAREAPERLRRFFIQTGGMLAALGLVGSLPLLIWGPELFRLFYGPNWGLAGTLAAIMVPATVINLAVAPVSRVFQLSPKAYLRLVPGLINVGGSLLVIWLADYCAFSLVETTAAISFVVGLHYAVYFAAGYFVAGHVRIDDLSQNQMAV
jgi:O-antigen/teichoic acid export membrane protein